MAYDTTQPTDSTKIRSLGTVIRPNWAAIEDAESTFKPVALNLNNRTALAVANDPTAITDATILYCKDDAAGNAQLYAIDENSVIYRLTGQVITETTNAGTAGGTLYKIDMPLGASQRFIQYFGRSSAFSGSATVILPETYTVLYSVGATANDANVQKISTTSTTSVITLRTENSVSVHWQAYGRI